MIHIILLLLGAEMIRRHWRILGLVGLVWFLLGLGLFIDGLDGSIWVRPHYLGLLMLAEGCFTTIAGLGSSGAPQRVRFAYGIMMLGLGILVIDAPWHNDLVIALIAGCGLLADSVWRFASAWVVRFAGWRTAIAYAGFEFALAVFALEPWPTWYKGEVGVLTGALLVVSGLNLVRIAAMLRLLPSNVPIGAILSPGHDSLLLRPIVPGTAGEPSGEAEAMPAGMTVHVWAPDGSVRAPVYRTVSRYIAATDRAGTISTGHAALELGPDVYISHYPAVEIDRSQIDFRRQLRGTRDNDVPGVFQPSYALESAAWCEASFHVTFRIFDAERLRAFWTAYRADMTYNLTTRNCSSVVAQAIEISVEGLLDRRRKALPPVLTLLFSPELWMAGLIRQRAQTMAWTPGLVLDYARALNAVLSPPPLSWSTRVARSFRWLRAGGAARERVLEGTIAGSPAA